MDFTTLKTLVTNFSHVKKGENICWDIFASIIYIYCDHNEKFKY